jgi:protein-S-isoprenylcysteine O-methyltransferase Ste14
VADLVGMMLQAVQVEVAAAVAADLVVQGLQEKDSPAEQILVVCIVVVVVLAVLVAKAVILDLFLEDMAVGDLD